MRRENPTQIIKYLEKNKEIHINGIIRNAFFAGLMIPGVIFGSELALAFLIIEAIGAVINFECINLQNYNICRLIKIKDKMEQREARIRKRDAERYKDISKNIHEAVMETDKIPTIEEILARADTPEKLEQLKQLLAKTKSQRNIPEGHVENGFQKAIK